MANRIRVEKIILPERRGNSREQYLYTIKVGKQEIEAIFDETEAEKAYEEIKSSLGMDFAHSLSEAEIDEIVSFQDNHPELCFSCQFRMKECERCVMVCESPLERKLFLALLKADFDPKLQVWIAKRNGEMYPRTSNFSPYNCLTRPDFYLESENGKYCIYADGFTYHNKSEEKVSKDRHIDSELQRFGYRVIRFPGKDIREDIQGVVRKIEQAVRS
ncbi:DUF559 domain-containing protein [Fodinibius sediminis]|uniref:DUF559 domain-containing protein n=1 Tax=Fodinibius sediminis TaxID=1214077 RepID=A0A521ATS8_9BACT|nr:DUF559 domain-containing protein [Fodinibius sediminis]SMO38020.1 Protein of unknown function [Fodinibius sediminis]